jgi:hypothetical protein
MPFPPLPPNLPPDRLDVELYKIDQVYDFELREQGRKILAEEGAAACDIDEHDRKFRRFIEEWNEAGMSKLARHVAYRKATLAFLSERLKLQRDGHYALEDSVHKIIFPLRTTSDDIRSDQMNLWIIRPWSTWKRSRSSWPNRSPGPNCWSPTPAVRPAPRPRVLVSRGRQRSIRSLLAPTPP